MHGTENYSTASKTYGKDHKRLCKYESGVLVLSQVVHGEDSISGKGRCQKNNNIVVLLRTKRESKKQRDMTKL